MSAAWIEEGVGRLLAVWLAHGVWQTSAVALAAGTALWLLRRSSARSRYGVGYLALVALVLSPLATLLLPRPAPVEAPVPASQGAPALVNEAVPALAAPSVVAAAPMQVQDSELAALAARLPALLVAVWLAGACGVAMRLMLGWRRMRERLLRPATPAPAELLQVAARVAERLGLRRAVAVLESPHAPSPLVVGVVRPVLVLPLGLSERLTAAQLEAVLAHELAHVRRHDALANLAQCLVEVVFFFHPAALWLSSRVRLEREHCCDDAAVQLCGSARVYSKALLGLEELRQSGPALALGVGSQPLLARVRRLLGQASASEPRGRLAARVGVGLMVLAASGAAWAWDGPAESARTGGKGHGILAGDSCTKPVYAKDFSAMASYQMEGRSIRNHIFVSRCGRVRLEPADGARVQTLLYDPSNRVTASLDLKARSYDLLQLPGRVGLPFHLPGGCTEASATCSLEGEEVVAGRRTQRFLRTHAPHDTVTNWVDRELGYPIREKADLFGTLTLEDIRVADLDPALFVVPSDFREITSE
ncbi:M56 family metallopeptidase [Hyalangium sp.]|uniref:M56 family metallopeptidase n=1 Tax=Hyalangium sp. TaxID=2028555 RepID=UPI002D3FA893|nr:M56 family metallopeptidase [Hyalangium sp.]HYI01023.1 M56 family metallopeptidase [Hyalangium sp.]